jgi:hypothetical protein
MPQPVQLTDTTMDGNVSRVTLASAVSLLARYCAGLPRDFYYDPKPVFEFFLVGPNGALIPHNSNWKEEGEPQEMELSDSEDEEGEIRPEIRRFVAVCYLPSSAPFTQPVIGNRTHFSPTQKIYHVRICQISFFAVLTLCSRCQQAQGKENRGSQDYQKIKRAGPIRFSFPPYHGKENAEVVARDSQESGCRSP